MNKSLLAISVSLFVLAGCQSTPVTSSPSPSPSASATPKPSVSPIFAGETTLRGSIALDALALIVEISSTDNSFRKAVETSNKAYLMNGVPVGKQIRVQAQYKNNPRVILSARVDTRPEQREQENLVNVSLESTVTDLLYVRAGSRNFTAFSSLAVSQFEADSRFLIQRQTVLETLKTIMKTPIDAQVVPLQTHPELLSKLDQAAAQIESILSGKPVEQPSPPTSSASPLTPQPSALPSAAAAFAPTRLLIKPGKNIIIARDTSLKLWVAGMDAANNTRTITPIWTPGTNSENATMTAAGVFTPRSAGTFTYTATYGNLAETLTITVTESDLDSLELDPSTNLTLDSNVPFEFHAKGKDKSGRDVTVTPSWELSNTFIGTIDENGVFTGKQTGRVDVTARARGFSSTLTVTVESAASFFIEMSPDRPVILTGKDQIFQVLAQDLSTNLSSFAFNFSVLDSSIGAFVNQDSSISGINPTAVFRAVKPGTTEIRVRDILSNITTTLPVTVADNVPYIASTSLQTPVVPGQTIILNGENFSANPSENQVFFNQIPGNVISASPTQLTVTVPIGAFSGYVTIMSKGLKGNGIPFVISPVLANIIPQEAQEGGLVTLTGQHFSTDNPAHNAVFFGGQKASIPLNVTGSSMQVLVPGNLGSEVDVAVRVKGQLSNFQKFTVSGSNVPNWDERQQALTSRSGAIAKAIDGKIYVIGGSQSSNSDNLEAYNIADNTWSNLLPMPTERAQAAAAVLDDFLYVAGGSGDPDRLDRYDPDSNSWTTLASMNHGRFGASAESYRGKLYVIGGNDFNGRIIEAYDPDTDEWTTLQTSPSRRVHAASAVYNGKIYVIGGGETAEDRVTAYDVDDDEWITGFAPLPKPITRAQAVMINSKIYVIGGEDQNGQEQDSVFEYDPAQNTWRTLKRLPSVRSGAAAAAYGSRMYVIGGFDANNNTVTTTFRGTL